MRLEKLSNKWLKAHQERNLSGAYLRSEASSPVPPTLLGSGLARGPTVQAVSSALLEKFEALFTTQITILCATRYTLIYHPDMPR